MPYKCADHSAYGDRPACQPLTDVQPLLFRLADEMNFVLGVESISYSATCDWLHWKCNLKKCAKN